MQGMHYPALLQGGRKNFELAISNNRWDVVNKKIEA